MLIPVVGVWFAFALIIVNSAMFLTIRSWYTRPIVKDSLKTDAEIDFDEFAKKYAHLL